MPHNKYSFFPQKNFISHLNAYLSQSSPYRFTVSHPAHFCFIRQYLPFPPAITVISPVNAVAYMGIRWWLALIDKGTPYLSCPFSHILDCHDNAGLAMAALRMGQKTIIFSQKSKQFSALRERAHSVQATILTEIPENFSLLTLKFTINS